MMEQRLIDANAVIDELKRTCDRLNDESSCRATAIGFIHLLENLPTVDAVEVMRCKDCVYYKPGKYFKDINFCQRLPYYAEKGGLNVSDEDFCSHGERRSAETSRDLSGYADKLREIKEGL